MRILTAFVTLALVAGCNGGKGEPETLARLQREETAAREKSLQELKTTLLQQQKAMAASRQDTLARLESLDASIAKLQAADKTIVDLFKANIAARAAREAKLAADSEKLAADSALKAEQDKYQAALEKFGALDPLKQAQVAASIKRVRSGQASQQDYQFAAEYGSEDDKTLAAKHWQQRGRKALEGSGVGPQSE